MSLTDQSLPQREFRLSHNVDKSYTTDEAPAAQRLSASEPYDDAIFDTFYGVGTTKMAQQQTEAAPPLPARNSLRASRLLDNLGLKLGGSLESQGPSQTTPHDFYLSSEEDASSSADDFSDYDYDYESGSEGALSPTRQRRSVEDTARVVSVIYIGKPSIIDLSTLPSRRQSCIGSVTSVPSRPSTSSTSLSSLSHPAKTSTVFPTGFSGKKRPPFLNIDPFANGSTYSLELPKETQDTPKPPRTPTKLLKNVTRTFSLVKKRSRPQLNLPAPASPSRDTLVSPLPRLEASDAVRTPVSPAAPVTYNDILRAARKNAKGSATQQQHLQVEAPQSPVSPLSPGGSRMSFLGGLAARRRSIKIVNGRLHSGAP